jgi:hypothetical protein
MYVTVGTCCTSWWTTARTNCYIATSDDGLIASRMWCLSKLQINSAAGWIIAARFDKRRQQNKTERSAHTAYHIYL